MTTSTFLLPTIEIHVARWHALYAELDQRNRDQRPTKRCCHQIAAIEGTIDACWERRRRALASASARTPSALGGTSDMPDSYNVSITSGNTVATLFDL